jgi:proline iminopeptidase
MLIGTGGARSDFWGELFANIRANRTFEDSVALAKLKTTEDFKKNDIDALQKYWKRFFKSYFYNQGLGDSLTIEFSETTVRNIPLIPSRPLGRIVWNYDIRGQLSNITCPTIIIHGDTDLIPLKYAEEINNHLVDSDLVILERCGHFPYIETPTEFSCWSAILWLRLQITKGFA